MLLTRIFLENFRNHQKSEYIFSRGITLFLGENGKGKTNVLEAIFALSTAKAFRAPKKEVFIMQQKEFGRVRGAFQERKKGGEEEELEIFWGLMPRKNKYTKNGIEYPVSDFIREKKFLAVLFSPEDMNLPVLSPSHRRRFLSRILSPLFPEYFEAMLKYEAILKNRNKLLKKFADGGVHKEEFFFWDNELMKYYDVLQDYRVKFFSAINAYISQIYQNISGKKESIEVVFQTSTEEKDFLSVLQNNFERDVFMQRTTKGAHRDDFQIVLRGIPLQEGASRGETRSALLALKMAEKKFVEEISGQKPLLLLDDVFSELDKNHQEHLLEYIKNSQVVITTTHSEVDLKDFEPTVYTL